MQQQELIKEISNEKNTQDDIAHKYASAIYSCLVKKEKFDWVVIDNMIIDKWGQSGLKYIRRMAWRINHHHEMWLSKRALRGFERQY